MADWSHSIIPLQLECTFNANDRAYIIAGIMLGRIPKAQWYWNFYAVCEVLSSY